jgi:Zn finger protein HypA/HybF involved in hydrogenase expression
MPYMKMEIHKFNRVCIKCGHRSKSIKYTKSTKNITICPRCKTKTYKVRL